ncbi:VWA domain-containing protein [Bacillus sp. S3]|uniref:vWA domain-containing protein n=1 Tax=Bacillus sp. S3 TaxID=486398 RepID=UPI00118A0156|nr:VWA domain-containing protein [Bacillus sp. S3]QCJ44163.1 VWA domain-containing protein [Bacillus sp. S3]
MVKKWINSLAAAAFLFWIIGPVHVHAVEPEYVSSRIEAVMVVDISKSMLFSDPNKISNEAMKMFVDMSSVKGDKIGVIAYGNDVLAKKDIVKIQSEQDKQGIKAFIDGLGYDPYTDMSVGLTEAVKSLDASHEKEYSPLIVLLADGNNDPDKSKGKTAKEADEQAEKAVADAKSKGYPIYVIGLNADGKLNKDLLRTIAASTTGKFFETSNANDLPGILSEIFADHLKLKVVPIHDVVAKEEFQDIKITIPNENVLEANISLVSSKPVELKLVDPEGQEQAIPSEKFPLTTSKNYSVLKLMAPAQGDWILKVKGYPEDKVEIKLVFNNDLPLKNTPLVQEAKAGDPADPAPLAADKNPAEEWQPFPWLYLAIAVAGVFLLAVIISIMAKRKKSRFGFSGQLIIEIKDESTGEWTNPQIKKLKAFKGEFCLNQLFSLEPEFKATDHITFVPITDNTLLFINTTKVQIEMGDVTIDAESGHRLRRNDKMRIRLADVNKSIYIANVS